jgi:hypothetical protein
MKKADLIAALEAKFFKVGNVTIADSSQAGQAVREQEGVMWYIAGVYEQSGDVLTRRNISFYVVDEGLPTEQAFYADAEPTPTLTPIASKWASVEGEIVRECGAFALVKRFDIVNGKAVAVQLLVKEVNGKITEFPIAEPVSLPQG